MEINSKVMNNITEYLNTLLIKEQKELIRDGYIRGSYILIDDFSHAVFRIPGCTVGGIIMDRGGKIIAFQVNKGYPMRYFVVGSEELEKGLCERFLGTNLEY